LNRENVWWFNQPAVKSRCRWKVSAGDDVLSEHDNVSRCLFVYPICISFREFWNLWWFGRPDIGGMLQFLCCWTSSLARSAPILVWQWFHSCDWQCVYFESQINGFLHCSAAHLKQNAVINQHLVFINIIIVRQAGCSTGLAIRDDPRNVWGLFNFFSSFNSSFPFHKCQRTLISNHYPIVIWLPSL